MARKHPARDTSRATTAASSRAVVTRVEVVRDFVPSVDLFEPGRDLTLTDADKRQIRRTKVDDVTHFRVGLQNLQQHARIARLLAPEVRALPRTVKGLVRNPDQSPAERVSVQPTLPLAGAVLGKGVLTDSLGLFTLPVPAVTDEQRRLILAAGIGLRLVGNRNAVQVRDVPVPAPGSQALGEILLEAPLEPLPLSIVGALLDLVSDLPAVTPGPGQSAATAMKVEIGQGACSIAFEEDTTIRRFPYKMLVRLIEPRTTNVVRVFDPAGEIEDAREGRLVAPVWSPQIASLLGIAQTRFVERVPVDKPIAIDAFRSHLIGLEAGDVIGTQRRVPMAGTLGLGYVLNLAQVWNYDGLTLGNLVYSLPLAPGEQQRIAIAERVATASVSDVERLDIAERQHSSLREDTSAQATFDSAFEEHVAASSHYRNEARSSSWGVAGGIGGILGPVAFGIGAGGGGGSSSNNGSTRSALDGVRSYASDATESMHRQVERQAAARRSAQRTSIRLATETDRETVTTKVITNHNKAHALTIQYWEVLRKFTGTTEVEGVNLVCFVPLDIVRFLPPGQPLELPDSFGVDTRRELLARYELLHRHADAVQPGLPLQHTEGLRLLQDFASNPSAAVNLTAPSMATLQFTLEGTYIPNDRVWLHVVLRGARRIGPVALDSPLTALTQREFGTRVALIDELKRRRDAEFRAMTGAVALPEGIDPADVVGFELRRAFDVLDYELDPAKNPEYAALVALDNGVNGVDLLKRIESTVRLTPRDLEQALGGPKVRGFRVRLNGGPDPIEADSLPNPSEFPPSVLPIAALQRQPSLGFRELLAIERTLQHVVRNTMTYSKAVWTSLTPEERVVLLEGFTIGLPAAGLDPSAFSDPSQHVPLLNCVANEVLGYYGNCMVMPFSIPAALATQLAGAEGEGEGRSEPLTTGAVQEALTLFHKEAFSPPTSHFTLPTRGVLGEAVLGHCPAAEKIDLTRFWNWQDSPTDEATAIANVGLRANTLAQLTAPSTLAGQPTIINNVAGEGGTTGTGSLISALAARAPAQGDFSDAFLGQDVLKALGGKTIDSAEAARKDALASATQLAGKALDASVDVFKFKENAKLAKKEEDKEKAKKDETKAEEDAKKLKEKQEAAVKELKANAKSYVAVADGIADDEKRTKFVDDVIKQLAGGPLPFNLAARLFADFDIKDPGNPTLRTRGSILWLDKLGLL